MSGSALNTAITALLRKELQHEYWAFLSPQNLQLGDFGYIDSDGAFERLGNQTFSASIGDPQTGGTYSFQEEGASASQGSAKVDGTFVDPEGAEVKGGISYGWSSTKQNAAQTTWNNAVTTAYDDLTAPLSYPPDVEALWPYAQQAGYITGSGTIKTGFCVVVEIVQIYAGVAAVSDSSTSEYTIEGSAEGVLDLVSGSAGGSFASVRSSSGMAEYTWPGPGTAQVGKQNVNDLHTVAVQLLTFDSHNDPVIYG
jgi:hypothetical protein